MTRILNALKKLASGRIVFILFTLTMAIYLLMLLYSIPMVERYAPNTALFDLSPSGYSYQHAVSLLEELGNEGRQVYLSRQLPVDFVYPGLFGFSYTLLLGESPSVENAAQWAEYTSSSKYTLAYYSLIYAYLIPIPGFWALHRLFSEERTTFLLSFWGMVLSILGSALPMAAMGVSAFAFPALARMSLSDGLDIAAFVGNIFTPGTMIFLLFSGFYYLVGIILFGVVLWKRRNLSLKIASIALVLHGFLIILPEQVTVNFLSWAFFLLSSVIVIVYSQKHSDKVFDER